MVFVCHITLQVHVIKAFYDFMVRSLSRYITILPSLVAIGTMIVGVRLSGELMFLESYGNCDVVNTVTLLL